MLATLRTYQDKVLSLADEAEGLLRRHGRTAMPRIAKLRIDQGVTMASYQLFVHREIFAPMMRSDDPAAVEAAKQLKVECIAFSNAFAHHVQEWSRRDAVAEWGSYEPAALAMIDELRRHVVLVRDALGPALGRWDRRIGDGEPVAAGSVRY